MLVLHTLHAIYLFRLRVASAYTQMIFLNVTAYQSITTAAPIPNGEITANEEKQNEREKKVEFFFSHSFSCSPFPTLCVRSVRPARTFELRLKFNEIIFKTKEMRSARDYVREI